MFVLNLLTVLFSRQVLHPTIGKWVFLEVALQYLHLILNSNREASQLRFALSFQERDLVYIGAQVEQVDEHRFACAVVAFEFEAYPEPKVLSAIELQALYARHKSFVRVGAVIGASEGFARQNLKTSKSRNGIP